MSTGIDFSRGVARFALALTLTLGVVPSVISLSAQTSTQPTIEPQAEALAFTGMTVIDVRTGQLHPKQTVVVIGSRIQAVGPADETPIPADARVVRADGTYMIPGLWDMHVHTFGYPDVFYPAFLANGVTGVREMSAPAFDSVDQWRREIFAGTRPGPRVVTTGPAIKYASRSGGRGHFRYVATMEEGRRVVDSLHTAGVDFIKFYGSFRQDTAEREVYFAIAAEARRLGLPLTGHLPASVTAEEASDSGQRSIEHELPGCFSRWPWGQYTYQQPPVQGCHALAARLRRNGTWLTVGPLDLPDQCHMPAQEADQLQPADCQMPRMWERRRYWIDSIVESRVGPVNNVDSLMRRIPAASLEQWAMLHREPSPRLRRVGEMHQAGIRLLAGTDVNPLLVLVLPSPGFTLHDLLWDFVRGGLTPLEALQTATINPAEYFEASDSLGSIAPGKLADFVLLDANPLVDIFNTRRIRAVMANGRFFDRGDLDILLAETARVARTTSSP